MRINWWDGDPDETKTTEHWDLDFLRKRREWKL